MSETSPPGASPRLRAHSSRRSSTRRPRPEEPKATCSNCAMCPPPDPVPGVTYFRTDLKCCTYQPQLPNYLVGAILADGDPAMDEGRRRIRAHIATRVGVTARWLAPSGKRTALLRASRASSFGRTTTLRCPYYLPEQGGHAQRSGGTASPCAAPSSASTPPAPTARPSGAPSTATCASSSARCANHAVTHARAHAHRAAAARRSDVARGAGGPAPLRRRLRSLLGHVAGSRRGALPPGHLRSRGRACPATDVDRASPTPISRSSAPLDRRRTGSSAGAPCCRRGSRSTSTGRPSRSRTGRCRHLQQVRAHQAFNARALRGAEGPPRRRDRGRVPRAPPPRSRGRRARGAAPRAPPAPGAGRTWGGTPSRPPFAPGSAGSGAPQAVVASAGRGRPRRAPGARAGGEGRAGPS